VVRNRDPPIGDFVQKTRGKSTGMVETYHSDCAIQRKIKQQ
jgi:hypothetical protein